MMNTPHRFYRWELLALLCAALFLNQGDRAIFGVVLAPIKQEFNFSDSQLGMIASLLFFTMALLMPVAGYVGDACSKKWIITCSIIFWSVATMLTGLAGGLIGMILFRSIATAGGETFYSPAANPLIAAYHKKTRAFALSAHHAALYIGVMTTGCVGGFIAEHWGWRSTFYIFGAAGVLLGFVCIFRLKDPPVEPDTAAKPAPPRVSPIKALSIVFRIPTAILLTVGYTAIVFVNISYGVWAPEFLREKYDLSLTAAGTYSMFSYNLAAFIGILVGGRLSDVFVPSRPRFRLAMQTASMFLGCPAIFIMGLADSFAVTCGAMTACGLVRGFYEANLHASLFDVIEPRRRASAVAIMAMVGVLIGSMSPWMMGHCRYVFRSDGLSYAFASLSIVFLIGGLAVLAAAIFTFRRDVRQLGSDSAL
jgi:MFS transporter, Spinster family, sphingosine-1-phosphate transporter